MTAKLENLEEKYARGELSSLEEGLLPFFHQHMDALKSFLAEFHNQEERHTLLLHLKAFLLFRNMPVNQKDYMESQSLFIRDCLQNQTGASLDLDDSVLRQKKVKDWIEDYAQKHRSDWILEQVYCLEKVAHKILPELEKVLAHAPK